MKKQNSLLISRRSSYFSKHKSALLSNHFPLSPRNLCSYSSTHVGDDNVYRHNRAINRFIKSGSLDSAVKLFDEMPERDVVTWNTMISGHYRSGFLEQSLRLYGQMVSRGILENPSTFSTVLSMCAIGKFFEDGLVVHCRAIVFGFCNNVYIGSALVDLYLRMGLTNVALKLFGALKERNLATWNIVLRSLCEAGKSKHFLSIYNEMKYDVLEPNGLTFCYLIQGCGHRRFLEEGLQLHCFVIKNGFVNSNLFVANALVDFYSACGKFIETKKSFAVIPKEDVISWNSMVSVCAANGYSFDALEYFNRMQFWGKRPSSCSILAFLKLSSTAENLFLGKQIHCYTLKLGFETVLVQSALIDMYGKCGDLDCSVGVFNSIRKKTVECCNSLMTSFLKSGLTEDAIDLFCLMLDEKIGFDETSLSSALKAVNVGPASSASASCPMLHCCAVKSGFESNVSVLCSLIDTYSKSGRPKSSFGLFRQIRSPNVPSFTSVISALARDGKGKECVQMLYEMVEKGIKPDKVTFLSVLTGCSHSGLVEEGRLVFSWMRAHLGPSLERKHYSCMVDLLGRAGLLEEAEEMIEGSPWEGDYVIWSSVLRSCRIHLHERVGRRAVKKLMEIEPENPSGWAQASSFYWEIGDFEAAKECREIAFARKVGKEIGRSWIEIF
ncbi:pentatricopeptide repeat-containing family protein [Striga asiatica]|uniref:Pentatricopeptide repeat-containing family protein n=1 Tax=Striga asiatica TaxID=4170 RepID=A0A5A7R2G1_STRAF|nr:pentatricopeptide repeat-containing family protein [Striga asiatica]